MWVWTAWLNWYCTVVSPLDQLKTLERKAIVKKKLGFYISSSSHFIRGTGSVSGPEAWLARLPSQHWLLRLRRASPGSASLWEPLGTDQQHSPCTSCRHCPPCCPPRHNPPCSFSSHGSEHASAEFNSSSSYRLCLGLAGKDQCLSCALQIRGEMRRDVFSTLRL